MHICCCRCYSALWLSNFCDKQNTYTYLLTNVRFLSIWSLCYRFTSSTTARPYIGICGRSLACDLMPAPAAVICRSVTSLSAMPARTAVASQTPHAADFTSSSSCSVCSAVFTCIGALGTPSRTGPLARKYLPGFPYSWSLRRLRQKISSICCTVICNYPSAAQEQPFTVGLFCITKTVKLSWPDMHC